MTTTKPNEDRVVITDAQITLVAIALAHANLRGRLQGIELPMPARETMLDAGAADMAATFRGTARYLLEQVMGRIQP